MKPPKTPSILTYVDDSEKVTHAIVSGLELPAYPVMSVRRAGAQNDILNFVHKLTCVSTLALHETAHSPSLHVTFCKHNSILI